MPGEAAQFVTVLETIARDALKQLRDISQTDLNRTLNLPESNSLFALATHLVGSGESWTLVTVGGRDIPRDRPAEFHATGTYAELEARYERWLAALHETLDTIPDERLDELVTPSSRRPILARASLLHAVEHSALHLGHIQITRQVLGYAPPPED